jgi:hypothetical protein
LCLFQELNTLSDQQALDAFGFDIRWRYALDVDGQDAYLSRRSLVEFRRRLASKDPDMMMVRTVFEGISKSAIEKLGLSTSEQRVDSTHIVSNICTRGRIDLFEKTIRHFIKSLDQRRFSRLPKNIQKWHQRQAEGWFGMGQTEHKQNLEQLSKYLHKLITIFKNDRQVTANEPYQLLVRLFSEQCKVVEKNGTENDQQIKVEKKSQGETLQSPFDPDASYGHKGKGYSVHITETCNNKDQREIITDYEVHGAARSDIGKAAGIIDRLDSIGLKPDTLFADGGYPSVPSSVKVIKRSVEFMAPVNRSRLPDDVMGRDRFTFDKDGMVLKCPERHKPIFDGDLCRACQRLEQCPVRAPNNRKRGCLPQDTAGNFRLEVTDQLRLRDQMYADQQTDHWKRRYKIRSGVEATMSELKRSHGMGKLRVRKAAKVCFAVACKVIACNIKRWAKAAMGSGSTLWHLIWLILSFIQATEAALSQLRPSHAAAN